MINSSWWPIGNLIISPFAGFLSAITIAVTVPLYVISKGAMVRWAALIGYLLMYATASIMIITTGHTESPFILSDAHHTCFRAILDVLGFLFICVVDAAYVTYLYTDQPWPDQSS